MTPDKLIAVPIKPQPEVELPAGCLPPVAAPMPRHEPAEAVASQREVPAAGKAITRRAALGRLVAASTAVATVTELAEPATSGTPVQTLASRPLRYTTGTSPIKQRAMADYQANMLRFGGRLSSPVSGLWQASPRGVPWQFDVLIIGSGYGASVTAARLAQHLRPQARLAILERGREWVPGCFPDTVQDMMEASRHQLFVNTAEVRNPHGLFNLRQFKDINVLSGTGLGGSSLINAAVAVRPEPEVFYQTYWPRELSDREFLIPYYERVEWELGVAREQLGHTDKMRAQQLAAEKLRDCGAHFEAAALALTRGPRGIELPLVNRQGLRQRACIDCGDCLTGCNVGAKNTLAMNYLPMARAAGAEIYTQIQVRSLLKGPGYYRVMAEYSPPGELSPKACQSVELTARIVILSAGSLGSSEILLRSASEDLALSSHLGKRWTGNGDALGFIQHTQHRTGIGGFGAYPADVPPVGPTIQTNVSYPQRPELRTHVLIQEGAAVRSYVNALSVLMGDLDLTNTQILLGMGHDGAEGCLSLDGDSVRLDWPGLTNSPYRQLIRQEFRKVAEAHGGQYKFLKIFGDRMISVHPLGGCGMAATPDQGVVNHKGQVFDVAMGGDIDATTQQPRVHAGLYVCDGAIFPTSIACNPMLTISALAERNAALLMREPEFQDLFTGQPEMIGRRLQSWSR